MAIALLAIIALAAVATTAAPTSFNEALMLSLGSGEAETLALALTLALEALAALRPVKDGIETAAEVTVAILELFCPGFCWSCLCCVLKAINRKEKGI
jgi:predicted nucleic acid-binding protein